MAINSKLQLTVVSQERQLFSSEVDSVTAPTSSGEITVLPGHIPLMSQLDYGELSYLANNDRQTLVVSKGFINVEPNSQVTVIVDAAKDVRDISIEKAQTAVEQAKHTMETSTNRRELLLAEASLRQALLEIRVAQKTKKSHI